MFYPLLAEAPRGRSGARGAGGGGGVSINKYIYIYTHIILTCTYMLTSIPDTCRNRPASGALGPRFLDQDSPAMATGISARKAVGRKGV